MDSRTVCILGMKTIVKVMRDPSLTFAEPPAWRWGGPSCQRLYVSGGLKNGVESGVYELRVRFCNGLVSLFLCHPSFSFVNAQWTILNP